MANVITDATIDYVGILAKLELTGEEKEQAKADMGRMLDYIDKLNELDTEGVEPMSHISVVAVCYHILPEYIGGGREQILKNAPGCKDGMFKVPRTVD